MLVRMPSVPDELLLSLQSLDPTPCGFAHEDADCHDPLQCPAQLQERRMGCAHARRDAFCAAVEFLAGAGRLSPEEAQEHLAELRRLQEDLLRLDIVAAHAYESARACGRAGGIPQELQEQQRSIIQQLEGIRERLVALILRD